MNYGYMRIRILISLAFLALAVLRLVGRGRW